MLAIPAQITECYNRKLGNVHIFLIRKYIVFGLLCIIINFNILHTWCLVFVYMFKPLQNSDSNCLNEDLAYTLLWC